ncbi:MAG: hypothetical protein SFW35_02210 [Chitinophagales bacterium]|nr:hypothetical protein [Chitinophagales bacterium]
MNTFKYLCCTLLLLMGINSNVIAQYSFAKSNRLVFTPVHEAGALLVFNQQRSDINNQYIIDLSSINAGFGLYYRYTFSYFTAIEASVTYYRVEGADRFVKDKTPKSNGWYRYIRNLSFRTDVVEAAAHFDVHAKKYQPFKLDKHRWTPYISGGVGVVYFNPKANYEGKWYSLQPLGTEGQGRPGYSPKYARTVWAAPVRLGIKANLTDHVNLQYFFGYTFVGTDYLDDVSTVYADPKDLDDLTAAIAMRADEVIGEEYYGRITAPGEQRGDPGDKDGYWTMGISLSFKLTSSTGRIKCARWR